MKKGRIRYEKGSLRGFVRFMRGIILAMLIVISTNGILIYRLNRINNVVPSQDMLSKYTAFSIIGSSVLMIVLLILISFVGIKRIERHSKDLNDSVKKAEEANEAKSIFLANMSHEIRTPLNAIIGFADILGKSVEDVKNKEYANVIHRSANTLLSIINDILDLSKIESGKIILELRSFNIYEHMSQIVDLYTVRADSKNLRMLYVIDSKVPKLIIGDSLRLQQVVSNLLGNAIKFTPSGGVITLSVTMVESYEEKVFLEFVVNDTGIGIPKEAQESIFTPFTQADGGITRNFGGTGLGLTISQKILQAMHSKLELESFLRQGSTFSFRVFFEKDLSLIHELSEHTSDEIVIALYPLEIAKHSNYERLRLLLNKMGDLQYISQISGVENFDIIGLLGHKDVAADYHMLRLYYPTTPMIYIGNVSHIEGHLKKDCFKDYFDNPIIENHLKMSMREIFKNDNKHEDDVQAEFEGHVLVAEDNTTNRLLIQILLEKIGFTVSFAKDGYEAITAVKEEAFDLIFMDIHMPKKDGIAAVKDILLIEKDEGRSHVPIIALTANALMGDREKYIDAGMDEYLSKPISEIQLDKVLRKFLKPLNKKVETILYDIEEAAKDIGVDRVTLDMLVENYYLTFDKDFEKLKLAVRLQDKKAILEAAHYLKGATMNLRFKKGSEMFKEIEQFTKDDQIDWIQLEPIETYFELVKKSLNL